MTAVEPEATPAAAVDPRELGDGPSSADTCGQFPADEVRDTFPEEIPFHGDPPPPEVTEPPADPPADPEPPPPAPE